MAAWMKRWRRSWALRLFRICWTSSASCRWTWLYATASEGDEPSRVCGRQVPLLTSGHAQTLFRLPYDSLMYSTDPALQTFRPSGHQKHQARRRTVNRNQSIACRIDVRKGFIVNITDALASATPRE
ncbi:hypothetical protein OF83DRAFT_239048 [Amylostereum chailletii]|nr:hypothetical protein OF83DRAFT_239048 [Amylostereum chailletii]